MRTLQLADEVLLQRRGSKEAVSCDEHSLGVYLMPVLLEIAVIQGRHTQGKEMRELLVEEESMR